MSAPSWFERCMKKETQTSRPSRTSPARVGEILLLRCDSRQGSKRSRPKHIERIVERIEQIEQKSYHSSSTIAGEQLRECYVLQRIAADHVDKLCVFQVRRQHRPAQVGIECPPAGLVVLQDLPFAHSLRAKRQWRGIGFFLFSPSLEDIIIPARSGNIQIRSLLYVWLRQAQPIVHVAEV